MSVTEFLRFNGVNVDLSGRVVTSSSVTGSPALAAETIVVTSPALSKGVPFALGCLVIVTYSITPGTSGVTLTTKIRQTNVSGTAVYTGTADTCVATNPRTVTVAAFDTAPASGQVYVGTATVGSGAAASTVAAASIVVVAI